MFMNFHLSNISSGVSMAPFTSRSPGLLLVLLVTQSRRIMIYLYSGSKAMQKLRDAICGKSGKNLEDLTHMTGMQRVV